MKLVYVVPSLKTTGVTKVVLNLVKKINKSDYDPYVLALRRDESDSFLIGLLRHENIKILFASDVDKISVNTIINYRKILKSIGPSIVHFESFISDLFILVTPKNVDRVATAHNINSVDFPLAYGAIRGKMMAIIQRALFKRMDAVTAVSKSVQNFLSQKKINSSLIYNGVDAAVRDNRVDRIFRVGKVFVSTSVLNERKNVGEVLEFFKKNIDNNLLVLGDGPFFEKYREEYSSTNIQFTGKVEDVGSYLKGAHYFISASRSEGLPMAAIEAMANNLPLVLSNISQHRELNPVESPYIQYFSIGDELSLQRAINLVKREDQARCDTREIFLSLFSSSVMANGYMTFYENLQSSSFHTH